tara:strand:+ start:1314 stop:1448 length:135 start_codon:yes stop_codon:yes gene_type:complete
MDSNEKAFFKNLVIPDGLDQLYWNNKRYTKEELFEIKNKIDSKG